MEAGESVRVTTASLTFECSQDNYATQHAYPRTTDPAAGKELLVEAVTDTTITINVGASGGGDQYVHRWVSACLLYTSPSPRDVHLSRMPSSA